jgi:hypothetical protein
LSAGGVAAKGDAFHCSSVARNDRLEHLLPTIGAVSVARSKRAALQIAELVEDKQWMVARTAAVAVPNALLLITVGRVHAGVHVEDDLLAWPVLADTIDPAPTQISKRAKIAVSREPSCLEPAHLAWRPARPFAALPPAIQRIAGS